MAETLFTIHSTLRYLVLLIGVIAAVVTFLAARRGRTDALDRGLAAAFAGVLDLQALLGIVLLTQWRFYGQLMGHITLMVVAVVFTHIRFAAAKRREDARAAGMIRFTAIVAVLAMILAGIAAIGRNII